MKRWLIFVALFGCGGDGARAGTGGSGTAGAGGDGAGGTAGAVMGEGPCNAKSIAMPIEGAMHVAVGTNVAYRSNPPSSGNHFPYWGTWGAHDPALERGHYVHNLEHGGVALLYKCDGSACPDAAGLRAFMDGRPQDPICTAPVRARFILTADASIPTAIAATAWGHVYLADCLDTTTLGAFVDAHYGKGPEAVCAQGQVP